MAHKSGDVRERFPAAEANQQPIVLVWRELCINLKRVGSVYGCGDGARLESRSEVAKGFLDLPFVHANVLVKAARGPEDSGTELWVGMNGKLVNFSHRVDIRLNIYFNPERPPIQQSLPTWHPIKVGAAGR